VRSNTFTPSTTFGASGTFPWFGIDAPSPSRKRLTTASALASWSTGGAEAAGDADGAWLIDGEAEADGEPEADAEDAGDCAEPLVAPGG
jgi:hypothetical protein